MTLGYYIILAPGNLYNAIVSENWPLFRHDLLNYALLVSAIVVVKVLRGVLRESAANHVRNHLSKKLHSSYFGDAPQELGYGASPYYRIAIEKRVDNPDQRIVADARQFSDSLFVLIAGGRSQGPDSGGLLEALASLVLYSYQTLWRTGWYGVVVAYFWSIVVSALTVLAINRTSPVVFQQERIEADFRFAHAELRTRVEDVSFMRGGSFERSKLDRNLQRAVSNQWVVITRHMLLNFVQYGFGYYISVVMYLALALAIRQNVFGGPATSFSSTMTPGEKAQWIAQAGGIFIQLLFSFTMVIQLGTTASDFVANANRLSALIGCLEEKSVDTPVGRDNSDTEPLIANENGLTPITMYCDASEGIIAQKLCVEPGGLSKVGPVSFAVKRGQWVLLDGPSGSGKSSIVRVLRGLWQPSDGILRIPTDERAVMFLPQRAYTTAGVHTLRQLVVYPHRCNGSEQERNDVLSALQAVGWRQEEVGKMVDRAEDWASRLSPGEAQLIGLARVLFAKPIFAVLDEPTASLDMEREESALKALRESGISGLIVGHSERLRAMHDNVVSMPHS